MMFFDNSHVFKNVVTSRSFKNPYGSYAELREGLKLRYFWPTVLCVQFWSSQLGYFRLG